MLEALVEQVRRTRRLVVLTGAGVSAPSGIPTYRNDAGDWQRSDPILHQAFVGSESSRRRYWARSMAGWRFVRDAQPNAAHQALVQLERSGRISMLVTQNVDRLHQRAGHREVVDLHGRIDRVVCLDCRLPLERAAVQLELERMNPPVERQFTAVRPDGDADIEENSLADFRVPDCPTCGGVLMPDVVFFGGSIPRQRVEGVNRAVENADALLVVGSSLMVHSGFRICRQAAELGKPVLIVNRGRTRADGLADVKVEEDCVQVLQTLQREMDRDSFVRGVPGFSGGSSSRRGS